MFNHEKIARYKLLLIILSTILLVIAILWSATGEKLELDIDGATHDIWDTGWSQILSTEEMLIIENTIPENASDTVLFFYTKDLEVNIYVDNIKIYSYEMQDRFEFLKTPGHLWHEISIPVEYSGKTLRMEFTSQFDNRFIGTLTKLYLIDECEVLSVLFSEEGYRFILTAITLLLALNAYINVIIWKRKKIKKYFLTLGTFCLSVALWLLSMSGVLNYILDMPITNLMICNLMILVMPITVYEFFKVLCNSHHRIIRLNGFMIWGNFFLQYILQFVFGISILDLLPLSYFVYVVGSISVLLLVISHIYKCVKKQHYIPKEDFPLVSTAIIVVAIIIEIAILCMYPERTDLIGIAGITGVSLYMITNQIALSRYEANVDLEKINIEEAYHLLQNTTLVQQIKAHFFFNTLNNISALCKYDPAEADRAITLFARYMHSYMYVINEKENISIEKELELVQVTLEIEKLRFPNTFNYDINISYSDFKIPPLSLQPLVENSLYHGLRPIKEGGQLKISITKTSNSIEVIVTDNGVGFEVSSLDNTDSIGLSNLKKRLHIMANGSVNIQSTKGLGTSIIITLPLEI